MNDHWNVFDANCVVGRHMKLQAGGLHTADDLEAEMDHFGIAATARASLGMYNTTDDIDALVRALGKVQELFG